MSEENIKDTENAEYSAFAVAFIDILGQKEYFEKLYDIENILSNFDEYQDQIAKAHKETYCIVKRLRKQFNEIFEGSRQSNVLHLVPEEKKELFLQMRKVCLNQFNFSDTIILYIPFGLDDGNGFFSNLMNGVHSMIAICGLLMLSSLYEKKPFRAGISFGLGVELDSGKGKEVYGPALYQAYEIEDREAQYPRIVVSKQLFQCLEKVVNDQTRDCFRCDEDKLASRETAKVSLRMIKRDFDGKFFVDYLGSGFESLYQHMNKEFIEKSFSGAYKFVQEEYARWVKAENQKLSSRYFFLLNYFEANKDRFQKPQNPPKPQNVSK